MRPAHCTGGVTRLGGSPRWAGHTEALPLLRCLLEFNPPEPFKPTYFLTSISCFDSVCSYVYLYLFSNLVKSWLLYFFRTSPGGSICLLFLLPPFLASSWHIGVWISSSSSSLSYSHLYCLLLPGQLSYSLILQLTNHLPHCSSAYQSRPGLSI